RASLEVSRETKGCWFCQTQPAGESSMKSSSDGGGSMFPRVSRTWRRMVFFEGSWRTRPRKSNCRTKWRRSASWWKRALRSCCCAMVSLTSSRASNCRLEESRGEEGRASRAGFCDSAMKTRIASGLAGSQLREGHAAGRAICVYSKRIGRGCVGEPREISGVRKPSEIIGAALWLVLLFVLPVFGLTGCAQGPQPQTGNPEEARGASASSAAPAGERYDLTKNEERGGHTLARHVARTDEELRDRLHHEGNISAASTWTDREIVEETIAEALRAERGRIESWMRRGYPRANLALHYEARRDIGRSLRKGETKAVRCRSAVIVLRADGPDSFYVLTAYPEARE